MTKQKETETGEAAAAEMELAVDSEYRKLLAQWIFLERGETISGADLLEHVSIPSID